MDIRKLISWFIILFFLYQNLVSQCDVNIKNCFNNTGKSKTVYMFLNNLLPNEPQKESIYLLEGYYYTFSSCVASGLGEVIFGIQNFKGELIKNNIISNNEIQENFEWYCKKSGFYHLVYWLYEGAGCIAVQVSRHPRKKFE